DAAREEGLAVVDPELLETIGAAHLFLGKAVVVAELVAHLVADVAEAVELGAALADLTAEHLIVVVQVVVAKRPARRPSGDRDGDVAGAEERDARPRTLVPPRDSGARV